MIMYCLEVLDAVVCECLLLMCCMMMFFCGLLQEVRALFKKPEVIDPSEMEALVWKPADLDGLVAYLVHDKQFSEERVRSAVDKMNAAKGKATQNRLESFFKVRDERCAWFCPLQSLSATDCLQ